MVKFVLFQSSRASLDFHQPHLVAIQETKTYSSVATSELFLETCPYNIYRKDRNRHGGGVMLLVHKDIAHMRNTELENDSESGGLKCLYYVASWYRQPGGYRDDFQLFRDQLDHIRKKMYNKKSYNNVKTCDDGRCY